MIALDATAKLDLLDSALAETRRLDVAIGGLLLAFRANGDEVGTLLRQARDIAELQLRARVVTLAGHDHFLSRWLEAVEEIAEALAVTSAHRRAHRRDRVVDELLAAEEAMRRLLADVVSTVAEEHEDFEFDASFED